MTRRRFSGRSTTRPSHQLWIAPADAAATGYPSGIATVPAGAKNDCLVSQNGNWYAGKLGPGGTIKVVDDRVGGLRNISAVTTSNGPARTRTRTKGL